MKYFTNCKTAEDVKQEYKRLAKELHPDCNPGKDTTEAFKAMQAEYFRAWDRLKNIHTNAAGETYERESSQTAEEYASMIDALLHIPGLVIELCGSWLWVTGETYKAKDQLKALKFRFSRNKAAWYYHAEPYRKHGKQEKSLSEIRNMYGSYRYATRTNEAEEPEALTA